MTPDLLAVRASTELLLLANARVGAHQATHTATAMLATLSSRCRCARLEFKTSLVFSEELKAGFSSLTAADDARPGQR